MVALDNLVINPSGEQSFNAAWTGTNGIVTTGDRNTVGVSDALVNSLTSENLYDSATGTDLLVSSITRLPSVAPYEGTGLIRYEVTAQAGVGYRFTPQGPSGTPHYNAFRINDDTRSIAFTAQLSSEQPVWVRPVARLVTIFNSSVSEVASIPLGTAVQLTGPISWVEVRRSLALTQQASHWFLDFVIYQNDPNLDPATPPAIGTVVYADAVLVPSSGTLAPTDVYFDGDMAGANWLGTANNSISYRGTPGVYVPPGITEYSGGGGGGGGGGFDGGGGLDGGGGGTVDVFVPPVTLFPADTTPVNVAEHIIGLTAPGGLCLNEDVVLGDMVFNRLDESGVLWVITNIQGWHTLPEPEIPDFTRAADDGSYEARGRYTARVITVSGSFYPSSPSQVAPARRKLLNSANLCHRGSWFATHEPDATRAARVWLSGSPEIETVNVAGRTDFSIGLKAPDPVKYGLNNRTLPGYYTGSARASNSNDGGGGGGGRVYRRKFPWSYQSAGSSPTIDPSQFGTTVNATNAGDTRIYPTITLTGPTFGPIEIQNSATQQTMRVVKNLNADDTLVIDCFNKSVSLNGSPNARFYLEMILDWIYLDPGGNQISWTSTSAQSTGVLTVQWRPGWIG